MKILHYSLGLPPYRSGGLTKYSIDLMLEQLQQGHQVYLLYPGQINPLQKQKIKKNQAYKNIQVYELINPLPVALLGGVFRPANFMEEPKVSSLYSDFFMSLKPDVIHMHTLMGIHSEFIEHARKIGIKLIFSTHDYYGICPKVNLLDVKGEICEDFESGQKCISCNVNSYSKSLITVMQSHLYKNFKNSSSIKKLRALKKSNIKGVEEQQSINDEHIEMKKDLAVAEEFQRLRNYYMKMLSTMDMVHFNSEVTKNEYEKYVNVENEIVSITHKDIKDQRKIKEYNSDQPLQIGFLGPIEKYKGFPLLRKALKNLLKEQEMDWHLHVYGNDRVVQLDEDRDYVSFHGRYEHEELPNIFEKIDILILPSLWKETFGFIGLEALSNGVPTIVTTYVGFKDLVDNYNTGLVVEPNEEEIGKGIKYAIHNRDELAVWNKNICTGTFNSIMKDHSQSLEVLYEKIVGEK
ncbi:glycosyltransferase [Priestia aryabhattai]|uniref:glycosyltransferase n=1 Tax=Priestia aryabhattai TaxID=412384 RepID=UPI0030EB93E5